MLRTVIGQRDHSVFVEHAQPVLHGFERRIELKRQPRGDRAFMNLRQKHAAHIGRQEPEADHQGDQKRRKRHVIAIADQHQPQGQRDGNGHRLQRHDPIHAEIARHNADHGSDGHRNGDKFGKGVAHHNKGNKAPDAIDGGRYGALDRLPALPEPGSGPIIGCRRVLFERKHVVIALGGGEDEG